VLVVCKMAIGVEELIVTSGALSAVEAGREVRVGGRRVLSRARVGGGRSDALAEVVCPSSGLCAPRLNRAGEFGWRHRTSSFAGASALARWAMRAAHCGLRRLRAE